MQRPNTPTNLAPPSLPAAPPPPPGRRLTGSLLPTTTTLRTTRSQLAILLRNPLVGYPTALFAITLAALLTQAFYQTLFTRNPFALFYAAVVLTAWVGGTGPGLLASAAAVAAINYFFIPSFGATVTDAAVEIGTFGFVALLVSSLNLRRRRAEQSLRQAKEAAEHANAAKDQFLAMLSHELRTPLSPVLTAAQIMTSDPTLSADTRESVEMILRNVDLEARLIDDLLDLTRIANGKINLHPQPVDTHTLIRHVLEICKSDIHAKQIETRVHLQADGAYVSADPARLQQVLWNLLKNATKFTPPGGTITVRTRNQGQGARGKGQAEDSKADAPSSSSSLAPCPLPLAPSLVIEIKDTGIGITPDHLPKIFDAFEQGDRTVTRQFGGLGLGLAITKALVDMHAGTLTAHSEGRGTGATFTIKLPTIPAPLPAPTTTPSTAPDRSPRSLRLLLVEDHADTARVMSRLLRSWSYDVSTAGTVQAALESAATEHFDLVISDLGLPDGTGIDLMADLRTRYNLRGIALTGHGMEEDIRKCHEAGFLTHLTKPVNIDALRGVIQQVLS